MIVNKRLKEIIRNVLRFAFSASCFCVVRWFLNSIIFAITPTTSSLLDYVPSPPTKLRCIQKPMPLFTIDSLTDLARVRHRRVPLPECTWIHSSIIKSLSSQSKCSRHTNSNKINHQNKSSHVTPRLPKIIPQLKSFDCKFLVIAGNATRIPSSSLVMSTWHPKRDVSVNPKARSNMSFSSSSGSGILS